MQQRKVVTPGSLQLPEELLSIIEGSPIFESSGESGARTLFVDRGDGLYLKIAPRGDLRDAALMQGYYSKIGMGCELVAYQSLDRDYMLVAAAKGHDGVHAAHTAEPERLSTLFGQTLKKLHSIDFRTCPARDQMPLLLAQAASLPFRQDHLTLLAPFIGPARAERAAAEILENAALLQTDALIHGDYCLPNIMIDHWRFSALIDLAQSGPGDRHYDLAWGLWTILYNLKQENFGWLFLDAYGRDQIDSQRLRVCGLLAAMD